MMFDPYQPTETIPEGESAHPGEFAQFDWDELERRMGGDAEGALRAARAEGAREMLSALVAACAEGVEKIAKKHDRSAAVGRRFVCAATILRPGQATSGTSEKIGNLLGITDVSVRRICLKLRRRLKEMDGARIHPKQL